MTEKLLLNIKLNFYEKQNFIAQIDRGGYLVLLLILPEIMGAQIYRWSADNLDPLADSRTTNCIDLPLYYENPDYDNHTAALDNSEAYGEPLKYGANPVLLGKRGCGWQFGLIDVITGEYFFYSFIDVPSPPWDKKFLIMGFVNALSHDFSGVNPNERPLYDYRANELFFDFPIQNQKLNTFYKLKIRTRSNEYTKSYSLALNKDVPQNQDYPWLESSDLNSFFGSSIQNGLYAVFNELNNEYVEIPFSIEESSVLQLFSDYQVAFTLNQGENLFVSVDEVILDCDDKNIVFDYDIVKCDIPSNNSCENVNYCITLKSDCTNLDFSNYSHYFKITNQSTFQQFIVQGQGEVTQFSMENLPAGLYDVQIFYTSANGYNEKVEGNYLFEYEKQFNHVITSAFTITENTTFDSPIYVPRDIVVNSPATLTVKDFAYFADNTKLIVKPGASLVVEGLGHLTACDNRWDGVIAEGNAKIIVNNNGSISFAKTGIFAKGDGASTITLSRAHFINNTVGLHALKSAIPVEELSYFTEGKTGVLLDNVTGGTAPNGVYFRGNEFAFMSREGILSYNTPIQVEDGNEFSYCYDGIALRNLFASNEQSLVGIQAAVNNEEYNYFENNQNAVYTNGSDVNIDNNIFTNNIFGGFYSGFSSIETERNNFSGTNGERYAGTGSNTSYSQFNEYQTATGITAQYDNTKYTFLSNCFQTGAWDVLAIGGNIALAQGNNSVAASNCFTGSSVPDFACGTPDKVLYFTPDPMVAHPVCLDPVFVSNYEVKDEADGENSGDCGTSFLPPSPGEYSYIRSLGCNLTLLNNHINSLRSQINAILNQPQPLSDLDKANLSWLSRHLRYTQQRLARCLRRQGLKQELYTFYKAQNERDFDIAAAGVLFDLGYVSDALLSLDTAWNTHGGDSLVLQGLKLNLLYRDSLNRSPLNSTDIFTLKTVAAKSDPYAGYARALLYKITGERIEPDTTIVIPRTRNTTDKNLSEKYLTSPNPAQDIIYINIENYLEDFEYNFKMYDIMGNMVKNGALKERSEIPALELSEGMYFIQIYKNGAQQKSLRTIILR